MTSDMKKRPLFSILHTSARPDKWREIYDAWIKAADRPDDVEYVLCVDERWGFINEKDGWLGAPLPFPDGKVVYNRDRRCYVDGVNTAAKASTGKILVVNADDQWPMQGWDSAIWQTILSSNKRPAAHERFMKSREEWEFVIEVSTGTPQEHERGIIVMPVMSRARYERLGYVFFPGYESMFADNDLHDHAAQDGVIIQAHGLMFPHRHPLFDDQGAWRKPTEQEWTKAYAEQNRQEAYTLGETILKWRRRIRFGDALKEAEQVEGWMTPAELAWLSRTASQMESIIEIGSWKGRSTYAICSGTVGSVYAVDHWDWTKISDEGMVNAYQRSESSTNSSDVYEEFAKNIVNRFPNVLAIRKDSVEAAKTLPKVEMTFVDGSHDEASVEADLNAYLEKTTKLICGHDYSDAPEHAGVVAAVTKVLGAVSVVPGTTIWYKVIGTEPIRSMAPPNGKTIAWCLPGEIFSAAVVHAVMTLYGYLLAKGYYVVIHQNFTSSPYVTREVLRLSIMDQAPAPDYVLWTDDDNPPSIEGFEKLLADLESADFVSCVSGWTWVDMQDGTFAVSAGVFNQDKTDVRTIPPEVIDEQTSLIEVAWTGFPIVLMKYKTLLAAGDKPFAAIPAPKSRWGMSGEDVAFCVNAKERGGCRLFVDPMVFVPHLKYGAIGPSGFRKKGPKDQEELAKAWTT